MPLMLVIADDLTGAADCGVACAAHGLHTLVAFSDTGEDLPAEALSLDANTRHLPPVQAAHETARRWPDNQRYLERSLYAGLLTGIEMETALSRCQKLYDARPNDSQRKLLMGLADIRMADPSACRRAVEGINLDDIAPGQRAVLCGLMKAMGFAKQAYELSQTIPDDIVMLPEEANFLRRAKQSPDVGVANAPLK